MVEFTRHTGIADYQLIDGILVCRLKSELIIDDRLVQRIITEKSELDIDEVVPLLIRVHEDHLLFEPQAFRLLAEDKGCEGLCAVAVVTRHSLRNLLVNISSTFVKSQIPLRFVNSRSEARLWLFNYIKDKEALY
ncbi:MAG: hypothetical protein KDC12_14405 [Flavobacteriales bacterium]|nr:hypothetical protein [Flavobacteriales bacterium]